MKIYDTVFYFRDIHLVGLSLYSVFLLLNVKIQKFSWQHSAYCTVTLNIRWRQVYENFYYNVAYHVRFIYLWLLYSYLELKETQQLENTLVTLKHTSTQKQWKAEIYISLLCISWIRIGIIKSKLIEFKKKTVFSEWASWFNELSYFFAFKQENSCSFLVSTTHLKLACTEHNFPLIFAYWSLRYEAQCK